MAPQELKQSVEDLRDSNHNKASVLELDQLDGPRATFYIPSDQSPVHEPEPDRRKEYTSRRPVVVLISMQRESPVEDGELLAAQNLHSQAGETDSQMAPLSGLEIHKEKLGGSSDLSKMNKSIPADVTRYNPSDIQDFLQLKPMVVPDPGRTSQSRPQGPTPVLESQPQKPQKKSSSQTVVVNMVEKPSSSIFSPPRRKLPFSK